MIKPVPVIQPVMRDRPRPRFRDYLKRWWILLLLPLSAGMILLARSDPALTESLYSSRVYPCFARTLGRLTSLLPFSLLELLVCAALAACVVLLLWALIHKSRVRRGLLQPEEPLGWGLLLERVIKLLCCLLFAFVLLCGLNYYRPEFASFSGLDVRESPSDELVALCTDLTLQANALREQVQTDENGVMQLQNSSSQTARQARESFGRLALEYEVLPDLPITPKPVLNSWWMSMLQITGIFTPYTFEANINIAAPDYNIPATMCHELAHSRGFMREDEANFIGYLACRESDSAEFQYSGTMLALVHSINRLYDADYDAFLEVNALMSEGVRLDFADNNAYWARYEGPVAEVSTAVNNTYLRVNNQSDGVQSYGRMVDLLLADYRARQDTAPPDSQPL